APTIEQQAALMADDGASDRLPSLVAIQPLGSKPPFFCVHGRSGHVLFCRELARHLGREQPCSGLQAQGLDGRTPPFSRIDAMAAHYIEEIRTVQTQGPYFLGGMSFGGRVAFEMAQQLGRRGHEVALLALFDTYGPGGPRTSSWRDRYRIDLHLAR